MSTIINGYNDATPETALKKMERRVRNGQVRRELKDIKRLIAAQPEEPPLVSIFDGEQHSTRKERAVLQHIRKLIDDEREATERMQRRAMAARYRAELRRRDHQYQKRRLLLEKLRRMEAGQWL